MKIMKHDGMFRSIAKGVSTILAKRIDDPMVMMVI